MTFRLGHGRISNCKQVDCRSAKLLHSFVSDVCASSTAVSEVGCSPFFLIATQAIQPWRTIAQAIADSPSVAVLGHYLSSASLVAGPRGQHCPCVRERQTK